MPPPNTGHVVFDAADRHVSVGTHANGACLTGHNGTYAVNSCSYRWQAHDFSKGDAARIAIHDTPIAGFLNKGLIKTSAYVTAKGGIYPIYYATHVKGPTAASQWYLAGPAAPYNAFGAVTVGIGQNFLHCCYPYWHNAHHLIPKGTFGLYIQSLGSPAAEAIQQDLLVGEYNINLYLNVLILPMDTEVAALFKLPRHLILDEGSAYTILQKEFMNHVEYNDKVGTDLTKVIKQWQANKVDITCYSAQRRKDLIDDLHVLSEWCINYITAFGAAHPGEPISGINWVDVFA